MEEENIINISNKLDLIIEKLDKIEEDIEYLKNGTENMNDHISFIDEVYNNIKSPFYYIMSKVSGKNYIKDTVKEKKICY